METLFVLDSRLNLCSSRLTRRDAARTWHRRASRLAAPALAAHGTVLALRCCNCARILTQDAGSWECAPSKAWFLTSSGSGTCVYAALGLRSVWVAQRAGCTALREWRARAGAAVGQTGVYTRRGWLQGAVGKWRAG